MTSLYIRPMGAVRRIIPRLPDLRGSSSSLHPSPQRRPTPQWHSHRSLQTGRSPVLAQTRTQTSATETTPSPEPQRTSTAPSSSPLSLPDQVRLLMRHVPYPVAIITATEPNPDPHDHHHHHTKDPSKAAFRGMTVSSFNTVTLTPEPVISFNVKRPSETLSALQSSTRFLVHLLAPGAATAALARDFSRGNHNLTMVNNDGTEGKFEFTPLPPKVLSTTTTTTSTPGAQENTNKDQDRLPLPLPLLRRKPSPKTDGEGKDKTATTISNDFPFVLECRLHPDSIQVHDHTIVVGTVVRALTATNLDSPEVAHTPAAADQLCLTYANTRFWAMGHEI